MAISVCGTLTKQSIVFSACGGLCTTISFYSLLSHAGLGHLGKGWIVRGTPLEDGLTGLTGSSTRAGTGSTGLQLIGSSVADCQQLCTVWESRFLMLTARPWPDTLLYVKVLRGQHEGVKATKFWLINRGNMLGSFSRFDHREIRPLWDLWVLLGVLTFSSSLKQSIKLGFLNSNFLFGPDVLENDITALHWPWALESQEYRGPLGRSH